MRIDFFQNIESNLGRNETYVAKAKQYFSWFIRCLKATGYLDL